MSEEVLVYSGQWPLTSALAAMLSDGDVVRVRCLYTPSSLAGALQGGGRRLVVLGINPHEHVMLLYRLQALLTGHDVVFVARYFYWTDYSLPSCFGLATAGFCTEDTLYGVGPDRVTADWLRQRYPRTGGEAVVIPTLLPGLKMSVVLAWVNFWLLRQMAAAGVTAAEREVLCEQSEGVTGRRGVKAGSLLKNRGLGKLMLGRHARSLYRGIKVREALQQPVPEENERKVSRRKSGINDERRYLRSGV
ncbi:TPA: hypothetical protein N3A08_004566 [Salmonella enterica subsp. salamae serovar 9,46:z4,z24:z39:z42]|nr:hypothetical protein [Salmonella enterica subsp. salamae serovar 9,46:z4,z24:z39:z42]